MTISCIICEFNPLHSGHKKLIDYAKSISDKVICVMSGNFTQRALPACADKYSRARHAILAGADMVVELPTIFATSSAQNFAYGAVAIAKDLGANYLVFGSECGDIDQLNDLATLLRQPQLNHKIKMLLSKGVSYPTALSKATQSQLLLSPNNTLAIEYLQAIKALNCNITPVTIKRDNNYNSCDAMEQFVSSTALRQDATLFEKYSFSYVKKDVDLQTEQKYCQFACTAMALQTAQNMQQIEGVTEGIENRFVQANKSDGYFQLLQQVKTKRFTHAKLQRIVLNCVLNVTKEAVTIAKENTIPVNVLAVSVDSLHLVALANQLPPHFVTIKADNLFYSLCDAKPLQKLQKI